MNRIQTRIAGVLLTASLLAVMLCCAANASADVRQDLASQSTIEKALQRGTLKVGFSTFVPWAMKDKKGEFIGFEIDVARELAKDMGLKLELVPTKWSGIIPALLTGKFDVIIGGMTVTPERNKKVNFTIPYYLSGLAIVADQKKAAGFTKLEDFNKADVTLVARIGTTAAAAAKKLFPKAELRLFDEEAQATQELLNGNVHAFISMAPLPAKLAIEHKDKLFMPIKGTITNEPNGFAVRKSDPDTLNYFDNWIRIKQLDGWMQERYHYWFETLDWEDQIN